MTSHDDPTTVGLLALATTALTEMSVGRDPQETIDLDVDSLVYSLVGYLRSCGINDKGVWDCPATAGIPPLTIQ